MRKKNYSAVSSKTCPNYHVFEVEGIKIGETNIQFI